MTVESNDEIRAIVTRLARPRAGGGHVIERAAILAAGSDSAAIEAWIVDHTGQAEQVAAPVLNGLHSRGLTASSSPRRYLLPGGVLGATTPPDMVPTR